MRRGYKIIKFAGIFMAIGFVVYLVRNYKISEISCISQYTKCSESIERKLEGLAGCYYTSCVRDIKRTLSEEPKVNEYSYQLKGYGKLEVLVKEQRARFSLKNESQRWTAQVSEGGVVLDLVENSELPSLITPDSLPNSGQKVEPETLLGLELVAGVDNLYDIDNAKLQNSDLHVVLEDGYSLIFPLTGDRDFLLGATVLILNELKKEEMDSKINLTQKKTVDLRFKNPVLK